MGGCRSIPPISSEFFAADTIAVYQKFNYRRAAEAQCFCDVVKFLQSIVRHFELESV